MAVESVKLKPFLVGNIFLVKKFRKIDRKRSKREENGKKRKKMFHVSDRRPVDGNDRQQKSAEKNAQSNAERYRHKHTWHRYQETMLILR